MGNLFQSVVSKLRSAAEAKRQEVKSQAPAQSSSSVGNNNSVFAQQKNSIENKTPNPFGPQQNQDDSYQWNLMLSEAEKALKSGNKGDIAPLQFTAADGTTQKIDLKINLTEEEQKALEGEEETEKQEETQKAAETAKTDFIAEAKEKQQEKIEAVLADRAHDNYDGGIGTGMSAKDAYSMIMSDKDFFTGTYSTSFEQTVCGIQKIVENQDWKVNVNGEDMRLVDAIADSFDSELDLYIESVVQEIIGRDGLGSTTKFENSGFLSPDARREMAAKGIRVDAIGDSDGKFTNRVYSFSLVDMSECPKGVDPYEWMYSEEGKEAKVLTDANGNEGSIILSDCVIPDGYYQGAEVNLSSILDAMGADAFTKADFIGKEDEYNKLISDVEAGLANGKYSAGQSLNDLYNATKDVAQSKYDLWHGGGGYLPGVWGGSAGAANTATGLGKEYDEFLKMLEEGLVSDNLEESPNATKADGKSEVAAEDVVAEVDIEKTDEYNDIYEELQADYKEKYGIEADRYTLEDLAEQAKEEYKKLYS